MKKVLYVALTVLTVFLCVACGGKTTTNGLSSNQYDPDNVDYNMSGEVRVWWGPMDFMKEPLERAIVNFNKLFPNVTIIPEYQLSSDYYNSLNLAYMNHTAPDVIRIDHVLLQSLGQSKKVYDLNELTGNKVTNDKEKFLDAAWDGVSIGNKLYGYPFDTNTTLLMYNEVICKEVFGDDYTPPTTYEELKADSLAVYNYEKDGKKPYKGLVMAIDANGTEHDIYVLNGWLSRFGASILNDERTRATLDTAEAIEAMEKLVDLKQSGAVQYIGYAPTLENEFLYNGTVAFIEMGSWVYNTIKLIDANDDGESDIKIAMMPQLKENIPGYATLGLFGLGITNQCKQENIPAAYEFIKFLATNYEAHLDYSTSSYTMPSLVAGYDDPFYSEGKDKEFWDVFEEQLKLSVPRPGTMLWPEITIELKTMERSLMAGRYKPKQILENSNKLLNELFEEMLG